MDETVGFDLTKDEVTIAVLQFVKAQGHDVPLDLSRVTLHGLNKRHREDGFHFRLNIKPQKPVSS